MGIFTESLGLSNEWKSDKEIIGRLHSKPIFEDPLMYFMQGGDLAAWHNLRTTVLAS